MEEIFCNCGNKAVECCSCSNPKRPLCIECSHINYLDRNTHNSLSLFAEINQTSLLLLQSFCKDQINACLTYKDKVSKTVQSYIKNIEEISARLIQDADKIIEESRDIIKFSHNLKHLKNFGIYSKIETLVRDGLINTKNLSNMFTLEDMDKVFSNICQKCKLYEENEKLLKNTNSISNKIINFRIAFDSKERLNAINKFNNKSNSSQKAIEILREPAKELAKNDKEQRFIHLAVPHTNILLRYDLETFQRTSLEINGLERPFSYAMGFSQTHDGLVFLTGGALECINRDDALQMEKSGITPERFYLISEDSYLIDPDTKSVKYNLKGYNLSDCGSCAYLNNFIYLFGGCLYDESWQSDCRKYDIIKNSLTTLPSQFIIYPSSCAFNNMILITGSTKKIILSFDPLLNTYCESFSAPDGRKSLIEGYNCVYLLCSRKFYELKKQNNKILTENAKLPISGIYCYPSKYKGDIYFISGRLDILTGNFYENYLVRYKVKNNRLEIISNLEKV